MDDSPNVQQGVSEEKTCKDIYYCSESSDEEEEFTPEEYCSESSDEEEEFTPKEFTPEEEDKIVEAFIGMVRKRVNTHNEKELKEKAEKRSEETDSKSSDDGGYWKHVRKCKEQRCDDFHKYEAKEEQKKVTGSKQPTFYFDL